MKMLINGVPVDRSKKIEVKNPVDNSTIDTVPLGNVHDVKNAIFAANKAKKAMKSISSRDLSRTLYEIHHDLSGKIREFAKSITLETGKTIRDSMVEMERSLDTILLSAEESKRIYGETIPIDAGIGGEGALGFTVRIPVGVVCAITPFNYPVNLAIHKIAPALAAKNSVVFKPSSKAPLTALKLAELINTHLPDGAINALTGNGNVMGDELVSSSLVNKVSFTGSVAVGTSIAQKSGMKKVTLELGGNDPLIVLEDADIDDAVKATLNGAYLNAGQVCISVKRVIVDETVADEFLDKLSILTKNLKVGDPLNPETDVGPLIDAEAAAHVEEMVDDAVKNGAELLCGGVRKGAYFQPTVLDGVTPQMNLVLRETFGPLAPVIRVNGVVEAFQVANQTDYGLQASVFTENLKNARYAVKTLDAGTVLINRATFRTDNMPFGGFKMSGIGKEGVKYALNDMTLEKLVII
ncbi:MAG TPA: lactaldehyde dehydrogenase [Methanobacterium sp.]|nr:lactaldehyde dehydrogenase [Methanobacterium sp.]